MIKDSHNPSLTFMLVDDNEMVLLANKRAVELDNSGHTIITMSNGQKAIDYLYQQSETIEKIPEIILLDLNMPEMNGLEFLLAFLALPEQITQRCKIFISSSAMEAGDMKTALRHKNVLGYFMNPLSVDQIHKISAIIKLKDRIS